jgi:ABC-type oligopeptide transport system ATPase subunit
MNAPQRNFIALDAKREHTPLLIGLVGPSGSGKTFSALRLATGIQSVVGGDIYFIDTENRRGLHYADKFKFKHVDMQPPFGSLDYLAALEFAVADGAKTIVVDSQSHEHSGPGGMVDLQETILQRMAGDDWRKRQAMQMLAWAEPKTKRRQLLDGMLRLNANIIFCFRAKNTSKPVKGEDGKTTVEKLGFMPIAGEEFVFEQTLNCLLLPGAEGVPTWHSEEVGERTMIKLPEQFRWLAERNKPLDEQIGAGLARWASGQEKPKKASNEPKCGRCGSVPPKEGDTVCAECADAIAEDLL